MVTQKDIAKKLGISQSTVACAFHPTLHKQISKTRRADILQAAREMGYVPNRAGRRLALARGDSPAVHFDQIGLIYMGDQIKRRDSVFSDSVFLSMMQGAERELSEQGAALTFVRVVEPAHWQKVQRLATGGSVDGWLLYGQVDDGVHQTMADGHLPWVVLGDHLSSAPLHDVTVDHPGVARLAVEHLAGLGHRRIAYIAGSMRMVYQRDCLAGFRAAIADLGLDADESLVGNMVLWPDLERLNMVERLMALPEPPTAIVTGEARWAEPTIEILRGLGYSVPSDVSVVGCETQLPDSETSPTRVEMAMEEVGSAGATLLHRVVHEPGLAPQTLTVPPTLVPGASTAPPTAKA